MSERPEYVKYAFEHTGEDYEDNIESFVSRWGVLSLETFARVLKEGQGDDIIIAIFALGYTQSIRARELLLPFLYSSQPKERWVSALCLGQMKEEQALPVLITMLTEFFPPKELPGSLADDLWFYNGCRQQALLILAEWARPEMMPALLEALQAFWHVEQLIPEHDTVARRYWRWCQGKAVYALGWMGRFDALEAVKVDATEAYRESWQVYLALGYLHAHLDSPEVFTRSWRLFPGLQEKVMRVLKEQLGLSEEEQKRCLASYQEMRW